MQRAELLIKVDTGLLIAMISLIFLTFISAPITTMSLLKKLWQSEDGALIAGEYLLMGTLLTIGLTVGIVAVRNATIIKLTELMCFIDPCTVSVDNMGNPVPGDYICPNATTPPCP